MLTQVRVLQLTKQAGIRRYTASDPDGPCELSEKALESSHYALRHYVESTVNESEKHELAE